MRPVRALPTPLMSRGQLPQSSCRPAPGWPALKAPAKLLPARPWLAGPERTSGRPCVGDHPIEHHVTGPWVRGPR
jgi:hypothetical protein